MLVIARPKVVPSLVRGSVDSLGYVIVYRVRGGFSIVWKTPMLDILSMLLFWVLVLLTIDLVVNILEILSLVGLANGVLEDVEA